MTLLSLSKSAVPKSFTTPNHIYNNFCPNGLNASVPPIRIPSMRPYLTSHIGRLGVSSTLGRPLLLLIANDYQMRFILRPCMPATVLKHRRIRAFKSNPKSEVSIVKHKIKTKDGLEVANLSPKTAIRYRCLGCSSYSPAEVRFCKFGAGETACALYPHRLGKKRGYSPPSLKSIRAHCLSCCGGSTTEVKLCPSETCALHPYRIGRNPARQGIGGRGNPNLASKV